MQTPLLIDSIVRQTTVLIAQLATSGGVRAPLAHVAGQVFVELARELEAQGVSRKVSADMFGMALRTYQRKTQRLRESVTMRGRSSGARRALVGHRLSRGADRSRCARQGIAPEKLDGALERLLSQGRIVAREHEGALRYQSRELFIPLDASVGWEAAVYDHFHAVVRTVCVKLGLSSDATQDSTRSSATRNRSHETCVISFY